MKLSNKEDVANDVDEQRTSIVKKVLRTIALSQDAVIGLSCI